MAQGGDSFSQHGRQTDLDKPLSGPSQRMGIMWRTAAN